MLQDRREGAAFSRASFAPTRTVRTSSFSDCRAAGAFEVASALGTPLDAFVVRRLGMPGQEELDGEVKELLALARAQRTKGAREDEEEMDPVR